jgi:hypothetical protein
MSLVADQIYRAVGILLVVAVVASARGAAAATGGGADTPCHTPNNPREALEKTGSPAVTASADGTTTALAGPTASSSPSNHSPAHSPIRPCHRTLPDT